MTLAEVIKNLDDFQDESLIFAAKNPTFKPDSVAVVIPFPRDESLPHEPEGMTYLLEVFLAKDVLETWSKWRGGRIPTVEEMIAALEYYHDFDSYLPVEGSGNPERFWESQRDLVL